MSQDLGAKARQAGVSYEWHNPMGRRSKVQVLPLFTALLLALTLSSPGAVQAHSPCGCEGENRTLMLTDPPLKGQDVAELQYVLSRMGFYFGPPTGVYDRITQRAVINLQRAHGLLPSGEVDTATYQALSNRVQPVAREAGEGPPPGSKIQILVDTDQLYLYLLVDGRVFRQYPVAIGKYTSPSPVGEWKIVDKSYESGGPFGTRWMGLNVPWGNYGIHGTNRPWSVGWPASAGCFRMLNEHVEEIFPWISVGTPVIVKGPLVPPTGPLKPGTISPEVVTLQARLREKGFYLFGPTDGDYGPMTVLAVKAFQIMEGIKPTGIADRQTLQALGFEVAPEAVASP
ncbi:MAG: peptidoglycan-binding protein [Thermoanaerobacteraceae bacterium]|nr:peptidoglycan-binding protein [Thermoanaerobacteraceae bacterium]